MDSFKEKEILEIVINNIPSFVFWKDRDSNYIGCNDNFAKSAGFASKNDIVGKTDYDMPWSKEESDFFRKIDKEVMDSRVSQLKFEEPQTNKNGEVRWLETNKIPLFDSNNEVIGILGTYEDITVRKNMELELINRNANLNAINSQLELVNIDLEQFAYATSHDFQEPLRMIGSFSGLLEKKYSKELGKEGSEYLEQIKEGTRRMSSLMNKLLSYSKIEKTTELLKEVYLEDIIQHVINDLVVIIRNKNAQINYNLPNEKVKCQPERISMLFHNLLTNGLKFNTSNVPVINISYIDKGEYWHFYVEDNGIGIENDYAKQIFEPFKRLNTRDVFPGDGIGLSICKRVVSIHGGEIWHEKNNQSGTTFHFTILKNFTCEV